MYKSFFMAQRLAVTMMLTTITFQVFAETDNDTLTIYSNVPEIEVVGKAVKQTTTNHTTVSGLVLNQTNAGQNLPYLLQSTPSLVVTSDDGLGVGYTYFRVRGTDHTRINMTVNDVPLNDSESQTVFWVNMTDMASSLSSLDVQRGVGTSTNGSAAFGASINMSTSRDAIYCVSSDTTQTSPQWGGVRGAVSFNAGSYNTFREMISAEVLLPKHFYVAGRFSKVNSDGYLERAASDLYSYYGAVGYQGKKTHIDLTAFGGKEKTYMAWDGIDKVTLERNPRYNPAGEYTDDNGNIAYYSNQTDNYKQQHVQLSLKIAPSNSPLRGRTQSMGKFPPSGGDGRGAGLGFALTLHYTHGGGYYEQYRVGKSFSSFGLPDYVAADGTTIDETDFIRQKHLNNHFYGAVASLRYLSDPLSIQFGGAANHYIGKHWGNLIYCRIEDYDLPDDYEFYRNQGDKTDANIYTKANWRILNTQKQQLALYADLQYRFVNYTINGINDEDLQPIPVHEVFHFFNPKAGITYTHKNHMTYASFAIANREPSRKNYTEAGPNDIPQSERLYDYELGYNYSHPRFQIGANLYFMDYDNQLVLTGKYSDTGAYLTRNVKDSYRTGFELTAKAIIWKSLPPRGNGKGAGLGFYWDGNLTLSRNRILNYTDWLDLYDTDWNWLTQEEVHFGHVDIAFSPSVTATSVFTLNYKGATIVLQTNVVGKQYLDNTMSEDAILQAYSVTNLNIHYCLPLPAHWPAITLRGQINNLFDAHYASNGGNWTCLFTDGTQYSTPWFYAQAGINFHAGFSILLW